LGQYRLIEKKMCTACFVKQHKRRTVLGRGTAHATQAWDNPNQCTKCSARLYRVLNTAGTFVTAFKGGRVSISQALSTTTRQELRQCAKLKKKKYPQE